MKIIKLSLVLVLFAFGCSKRETVANLGVIELAPNVPKHFKVGDVDWTITEKRLASGRQTITAESAERKVTEKDVLDQTVPPNVTIGSILKETFDLSGMPVGVEIYGNFSGRPARYTLKYDAN